MRTKIFLPCLLALIIIIALFIGCRVQNPTLVVTVGLDLTVLRASNSMSGYGRILELNTSVSVTKWPQTVPESVYVNPLPRFSSNETRATPVRFAVSIYLDGTNKTFLTPDNLVTTGEYSAQVISTFSNPGQGMHNLTMAVYVPGHENHMDQLTRFITIP